MAIPGVRGVDHVGLTVPDMAQAVGFFVEVLGAEAFYSVGPFPDDGTDANEISFGVHPRAVLHEIRLLRFNNINVELFEWEAPDQRREPPRLSDVGASELCLYVDDMDDAIAALRRNGVEVLGEKLALDGPEAGPDATYQYFRTPWGAVMELISYPHGRAYEASSARRLFNPANPQLEE
jgi:catechol 2,3-dioxygenase-like lactoylglutathione lyase family enzyme